jgi:hypothetical protein
LDLYDWTTSRNIWKRFSVSRGPAQCSGWNWTLKNGLESWTMPSLDWSFWFVNKILQSWAKPSDVWTAKPWFCDVIKQRWVPSNKHG